MATFIPNRSNFYFYPQNRKQQLPKAGPYVESSLPGKASVKLDKFSRWNNHKLLYSWSGEPLWMDLRDREHPSLPFNPIPNKGISYTAKTNPVGISIPWLEWETDSTGFVDISLKTGGAFSPFFSSASIASILEADVPVTIGNHNTYISFYSPTSYYRYSYEREPYSTPWAGQGFVPRKKEPLFITFGETRALFYFTDVLGKFPIGAMDMAQWNRYKTGDGMGYKSYETGEWIPVGGGSFVGVSLGRNSAASFSIGPFVFVVPAFYPSYFPNLRVGKTYNLKIVLLTTLCTKVKDNSIYNVKQGVLEDFQCTYSFKAK